MSAYTKQSPQQQSYSARLSPPHQVDPNHSTTSSYGSYQPSAPAYQPQQTQQQAPPPPPPSNAPSSEQQTPSHNNYDSSSNQSQQLPASDPSLESQSNSYHSDAASMPLPTIVGSFPSSGPQGEQFNVLLQSPVDLTRDSRSFKIMFGSRRCNTTISKAPDANGDMQYTLTTSVPSMSLTGWFGSNRVSVYMNVEDEQGQELSTEQVSEYTYTDVSPPQTYTTSPPLGSRKRKVSPSAEDSRIGERPHSPSKRLSGLPDMRPKSDDYSYSYPTATTAPYSYIPQSATTDRSFDNVYDQSDRHDNSSFKPHRPLSAIYTSSSFNFRPRSELPPYPQTTSSPGWPSMYPVTSSPGLSGIHGGSPSQQIGHTSSPTDPSNPPLVRTSTLQQSSQANPGPGGAPFNPYAVYPNRAVLKLNGNIDSMAEHWTEEEWHNRRRLVQFWRQQKGNAIHASFAPVSQSDRQSNSICISCIWWAEKNAAYVTSVDCIYLLESLIAVRFTVEEKNRIRRNLEGFHPLTVSKAKADSENFFKLIMGFPNPKPRNIEKDVKVFPWKILGMALKKIIGKYSASYSSTASALPSVNPSSGYPTSMSLQRTGSDDGHSASPRSIGDSPASSLTHSGPTYGTPSPGLSGPPPHLQHRESLPMLGGPLSQSPVVGNQWRQPPPQGHLPQQQAPRASWELGPGLSGFLDNAGGHGGAPGYPKGHAIPNGH